MFVLSISNCFPQWPVWMLPCFGCQASPVTEIGAALCWLPWRLQNNPHITYPLPTHLCLSHSLIPAWSTGQISGVCRPRRALNTVQASVWKQEQQAPLAPTLNKEWVPKCILECQDFIQRSQKVNCSRFYFIIFHKLTFAAFSGKVLFQGEC